MHTAEIYARRSRACLVRKPASVLVLVVGFLLVPFGVATASPTQGPVKSLDPVAAQRLANQNVSKLSDTQLTRMAASWDSLPRQHKQALLREMKIRMARQRGRSGVPQLRSERRFGKLVRRADGSVVRVETRVIRIRPSGSARGGTPVGPSETDQNVGQRASTASEAERSATQTDRPRFGVGFERRIILRAKPRRERVPTEVAVDSPLDRGLDPTRNPRQDPRQDLEAAP